MPSSRPRLNGVTLCGPEPIGRVHIDLRSPLSVLYGRNGAGKTLTLRALGDALRGVRADGGGFGAIHVTIPSPAEIVDLPFQQHLVARGLENLALESSRAVLASRRRGDGNFDSPLSWGDPTVERFFRELEEEDFRPGSLEEVIRAHCDARQVASGDPDEDLAPLLGIIQRGGELVLVASGTALSPRWLVYAAMPNIAPVDTLVKNEWTFLQELLSLADNTSDLSKEDHLNAVHRLLTDGRPRFPWDTFSNFGTTFVGLNSDWVARGHSTLATIAAVPWEDWVTFPVVKIAEISQPVARVFVDDPGEGDASQIMRDAILATAETPGRVIAVYDDGQSLLDPTTEDFVREVSKTATRMSRLIMDDAPELVFNLPDPNDWLRGELPRWMARMPSGNQLPIEALSAAQRRWANLCCALAVDACSDSGHGIVLCDEPEAGLHRLAEQRLPRALAEIAIDVGANVVVASHSPAMLDNATCQPSHVTRLASGDVTIRSLSVHLREELGRDLAQLELGLTPSDLLQMVRTVVIVEGPHDELVLGALLGEHLDKSVVIFQIGGAKQIASLASAHLLWDYTDAAVVVVVDGIARNDIQPIWEKAMNLASMGNPAGAKQALSPLGRMDGGEPRWIRQFLIRAIDSGQTDRISLEPLSEPDIICYLPAHCFVPGQTWEELKAAWVADARRQGSQARDIKGFLKRRHRSETDLKAIQRALGDAVPNHEIERLCLRLNEIAAFQRAR